MADPSNFRNDACIYVFQLTYPKYYIWIEIKLVQVT